VRPYCVGWEFIREHGQRKVVQVATKGDIACTVVFPSKGGDISGLIIMGIDTLMMVHAKRRLPAFAVEKRSSLAYNTRVEYLIGMLIAKGVANT